MTFGTWEAVATVVSSMVVVGGAVAATVRHMLRADFVAQPDFAAVVRRVEGVEKHIGAMPSEAAFRALADKVGDVNTRVAVAQTTIEGVGAGLKRVEHTTSLMLDRMLERDQK